MDVDGPEENGFVLDVEVLDNGIVLALNGFVPPEFRFDSFGDWTGVDEYGGLDGV